MFSSRSCLGSLVAALLCAACATAQAEGAGKVRHLSGILYVQRPDGAMHILSQKSAINPGEMLTTHENSYAQIDFADGSSMTMRPNTRMKVENFRFSQDKPQEDSAFFRLVRGGLRTVTGLIGKRGDEDAYSIETSSGTIGIRGSSGDTLDCTQGCEGVTSTSGKLEKGVYHTTYTGRYIIRNEAGLQIIGEGQFGFAKDSSTAPRVLLNDPGMNLMTLPFMPAVTRQGAGAGAGQGTGQGAAQGVGSGVEKEARQGTGSSAGQGANPGAGESTGKSVAIGAGQSISLGAGDGTGKGIAIRAGQGVIPSGGESTGKGVAIGVGQGAGWGSGNGVGGGGPMGGARPGLGNRR